MRVVNIREAKTRLSMLVEQAAAGESFIIAKAGKPLVQITRLAQTPATKKRTGLMTGQIAVPDDFDQIAAVEITDWLGVEG